MVGFILHACTSTSDMHGSWMVLLLSLFSLSQHVQAFRSGNLNIAHNIIFLDTK
jgi:hypothetical protein